MVSYLVDGDSNGLSHLVVESELELWLIESETATLDSARTQSHGDSVQLQDLFPDCVRLHSIVDGRQLIGGEFTIRTIDYVLEMKE